MFAPTASPVVNAHITWHMGPTTCVSTSRNFAQRETQSSSRPASHSRIAGSEASIQRPSAAASAAERQMKHEARVIRSPSTSVRKPPDSAAALAPR
jgi:hypothetical protein